MDFKKNFILLMLLVPFWSLFAQTGDECPCCTEDHNAFDFWVGTWEVRLADGTKAGVNRIVKAEGGCVLQEHWKSANQGFTGTSLNYLNTTTGQWEQLWVDRSGNILKLKGNREGDQMILTSDPFKGPEGSERTNRITWTLREDGTVRQLWEVLEKGSAVQVLFDGYYHPLSE